MSDYQKDLASMAASQAKMILDVKKEIKRQIRLAYKTGGTVPYDMGTLIGSRVSVKVIRAVYRG